MRMKSTALRLETFLTTLRNEGVISEWHDRKINPGEVWNQEIKNNLIGRHRTPASQPALYRFYVLQ